MKIKPGVVLLGMGIVLLMARAAGAEDICSEPVATGSGLVRGESETETAACVWRGIPFAAPPVGDRRWQSPQPPAPWSGVRDAARFGSRCMQSGIFALEGIASDVEMSEDCLYLNVWRPQKSGRFPVMVWIHGGGYYGGSAMTPWYWGDRLASAGDLVVVTINYRLNIFGFLADPALREEDQHRATGGQGSLDQVAALQWVRDNIRNFGGDPDNVTIFGESAGGWSVCTMLATPLNRGLFQRAILESGGCEQSQELEKGYATARSIAAKLGCPADDLACLRSRPAKQVLKQAGGGMGKMEFMPHHDGYLLTDTPLAMIRAGNYNQVSFMAGSNRDEFGKALKLFHQYRRIKPEDYEKQLKETFGLSAEAARAAVELYPLAQFQNRPVEAYGRMLGADLALACPTYLGLAAAAGRQPGVYYYRFDYDGMKYGRYFGAAHAFEIPFIFDSLDRLPANVFYNKKNLVEARALLRIIQGYWIAFAKTGNPNGTELPNWPAFAPEAPTVQVLDTEVRTEPANMTERCSFWEEHGEEIKVKF